MGTKVQTKRIFTPSSAVSNIRQNASELCTKNFYFYFLIGKQQKKRILEKKEYEGITSYYPHR